MTRPIRGRVRELEPVHLREARIPERYWRSSIDKLNERSADLAQWAFHTTEDPASWLGEGLGFLLHGPFNTGKSSIAAILAMDAIKRCEVVLWLPVTDVPRVRFREDADAKAIDERLRRADLLVLDDLGSERFRLATAAGTALEETVRAIYDRGRSLVISSNIKWERFSGVYGTDLPGFLSVLERMVSPVEVNSGEWPKATERGS